MKSQINILRQLQELILTRDEHNQTGDGSHLDQLSDSIAQLADKLEPQVAGVYNRLYKKNHIFISAMTNNLCAACGMQVPIAQVQQVRFAQHLVTCSNCGRILFATDDGDVQNTSEPSDRDNPKTGISRFSDMNLMIPEFKSKTREGAIQELSEAMERGKFISSAANLTAAALDRESILSTAMEGAMAFPHVRGVEGGALTLALGISKEGIDWDGEKVNLVFLSAIPVAVSAFYLRLVSGLVQTFDKDVNRKALLNAKDAKELWKALQRTTRPLVK